MDPSGLPHLRDVIGEHNLWAKKSLGQNFILDMNVTSKIAQTCCHRGAMASQVLEVGPGPGGLTRALLLNGVKKVVVIEKDPRCLDILKNLQNYFGEDRLKIIQGDALKIRPQDIMEGDFDIASNLPYNIGTILLMQWLADHENIQGMTLMFQKEVADRLVAKPHTSEYGRLSVMTQWKHDVNLLHQLPPEVFTPAPKVHSTVVRIVPRTSVTTDTPSGMFEKHITWNQLSKVVATAFQQRRKMLRAALKHLVGDHREIWELASIDPTKRAENLSGEEFCRLTHFLNSLEA
jgi:16S rRNA (adenine1518-N6/adenine1519-N6)-dimethyltransferase